MKLGRVAPALLQAFRDNALTLECLMAFTITDDHARQLDVWEKIKNGHFHAHYIRRMLTEDAVRSTSKVAKFVGEEDYEAAGGIISRDLFEEDCYFENAALLEALAMKRLEEHVSEKRNNGWTSVVMLTDSQQPDLSAFRLTQPNYIDAPEDKMQQLETQLHRLESLEHGTYDDDDANEDTLAQEYDQLSQSVETLQEALSQYLGYPDECKAEATLVLSIANDGSLREQAYMPLPEIYKTPETDGSDNTGDDEHGCDDTLESSSSSPTPAKPASDTLSQSLSSDLNVYRMQILQTAVADDFDAAFDLMTFSLAQKTLSDYTTHGYSSSPVDVALTLFSYNTAQDDAAFTKSGMKHQEQRNGLALDWLMKEDDATRYTAFCALSVVQKQTIFSYCTSLGLQSWVRQPHPALGMTQARLNVQPHQWWRPTESNFFKRLKKPQLLKLVDELLGDSWLAKVADHKKGQLATWLGRVFEGNPSAISGMDEVALTAIDEWMPDAMRFNVAHRVSTNSDDTADHDDDTGNAETQQTSEDGDTEQLPDWMCEDAA